MDESSDLNLLKTEKVKGKGNCLKLSTLLIFFAVFIAFLIGVTGLSAFFMQNSESECPRERVLSKDLWVCANRLKTCLEKPLPILPLPKIVSKCPSRWIFVEELAACFKPIHNVNYEMANDLCKSMSSHLVTVENEEKNALVLELTKSGILSESFSTQTLLGAKKRKSLKLTWSHGLINNFTKWVDEKMIEENDERKCVAMITDNAEKWIDSLWMTVPCETMQRISLCEMKAFS